MLQFMAGKHKPRAKWYTSCWDLAPAAGSSHTIQVTEEETTPMDKQQGKAAGRQPKLVGTEASPTGMRQRNPRVSGIGLLFAGMAISGIAI